MTYEEYEIRQRAQAELDSCNEMLADRAQRQTTHVVHGAVEPPRPPEPAYRAEERRIREERAHAAGIAAATSSAALRQVRKKIMSAVVKLAEEVGTDVEDLQARIKQQDVRIAELEATVTDLLSALERKVDGLEQRAVLKTAKPRLVAGIPPNAIA